MANRLQHLRGSEAEHSTFTGAKGEISLVTDTSANRIPTGEVRVHDGTTAGGLPLTLGTTSKPLTNNIVLGSGVGINFNNYGSEDSNSATTVGSNLLDDYEEGSWTPSPTQGSISGTSIVYTGKYTLVGNKLTLFMQATSSSDNLQVSSYVGFSGVPFAITTAGTSTVITEDIDFASRHGFSYLGTGQRLFFSACGSSSGTSQLVTTITTII